MSSQVTLTLNPAFRVAPVRRRTFGAFVEHLGRCVYTGIFEPDQPAGRRGRLPHRRPGADPRARGELRALPGRQLRLRLPLGGRHRPGGGAARAPRPRLALHRPQHGGPGRVHDLGAEGRGGADVCDQPRRPAASRRRWTCSSTPTPRRASRSRTSAPPAVGPSPMGSACGTWATRWTAPGRPATRPPRSTRAWRPRPRAPCARRTRTSSSSPAAPRTPRCPPSGPGRRRCSPRPMTTWIWSQATSTTRRRTATRPPSSAWPTTWTTSSTPSSPPPITCAPRSSATSAS